ncbi:response regulator transcription factor [Alteraurantiacibacter palmitatis]|uniref:Response regulator n=1 Tax=Alteraurantiacibacter palmitatis TaxID=2054628 RepID=A0ABV7E8X0_9SPHN
MMTVSALEQDDAATLPRILIVDDHPLAREGLRAVLSAGGFDVVADVGTGEEAVELAERLVPDVVLMDLRLGPGIDGLEATRRITALGLPVRVLMLTLHDMPGYVREALVAGASGYVLKDTGIAELRTAVAQVLAGQGAIPLDLIASAMDGGAEDTAAAARHRRQAEALGSLTQREREVLDLVALGQTNKEIARSLTISPATVKAHVERIISKLGVSDRTQAAVVATRSGFAE